MKIVHEKLNHRINYADGMAHIERKGGRPVTRDQLRDYINDKLNGKPIFPNQVQWVPIWADEYSKGADWMQVGEGEGEPGTSWLEESNGG